MDEPISVTKIIVGSALVFLCCAIFAGVILGVFLGVAYLTARLFGV